MFLRSRPPRCGARDLLCCWTVSVLALAAAAGALLAEAARFAAPSEARPQWLERAGGPPLAMLLPLSVPVAAFFVYAHWLGFSFFTNN